MGARREAELHGLADNLRAAVGHAAEDGEWDASTAAAVAARVARAAGPDDQGGLDGAQCARYSGSTRRPGGNVRRLRRAVHEPAQPPAQAVGEKNAATAAEHAAYRRSI